MNGPEEAVLRKIIHFLDIVRCSAYVSDLLYTAQHLLERFDSHLSCIACARLIYDILMPTIAFVLKTNLFERLIF